MSRPWQSREVTRVRGEFEVTPQVVNAVNEFLKKPIPPKDFRLYSTAQRIMPAAEFEKSRYGHELGGKGGRDELVGALAKRTLVLAEMTGVHIYPNDSARMFFQVRPKDQPKLDEISELIGDSVGTGARLSQHMLYAEFLPNVLDYKNQGKVQTAMGRLAAQLHHPSAERRMHVYNGSIKKMNLPDHLISYGVLPKEA
jgi:hypothetical protein